MSKDFRLEDKKNIDMYLVLLRYFDGRIENINDKILKALKKGKDKDGTVIEHIDKKVLKLLRKILTLKKENAEEYASINFIYPEWSEEEKLRRLKEKFPNDYPDDNKEVEDESDDVEDVEDVEDMKEVYSEEIKSITEEYKSILPQRKAFIKWINDVFYKKVLEDHKGNKDELSKIKIYQYFVSQYLKIESPFRGLLIYHGLGTGKTATSVVTAEGLSKKMKIYTFLPASLETEYIKEVRAWGNNLFKIESNNWIFYPIDEIKGNIKLRKLLKDKYNIEESNINSIYNLTKSKLTSKLNRESPTYKKEAGTINKKLNELKGFYIPTESISDEYRDIFTITGKPILKPGETYTCTNNEEGKKGEGSGKICYKISEELMKYIEEQITVLIRMKYNFIHYNGFPDVHLYDFNDKTILDTAPNNTDNQKMLIQFAKDYQYNINNYHIKTPFKDKVIVIDEVHNFVREIMNNSAPANIFYNWITDSEDTKIIFLSGTPIINKPAEIAILFNMLRGSLFVFNFSILSNENEIDIQEKLRNIFYTEKSSIEQLHVTKKMGKLVISFIKNKTGFESIMEDGIIKTIKYNNHELPEFFNEIYKGLNDVFDKDKIIPSKVDIDELITNGINVDIELPDGKIKTVKRSIIDLKTGTSIVFDKETNIIFNRKQKLFEIYQDNTLFDLSNNETFVEYFFDDTLNIPTKKQVLLRRMLLGLTSYYPIDRSSIVDMPTINPPKEIPERYKEYNIIKNINVIPCYMSSIQWIAYENQYTKEKLKRLNQMRKKDMYEDQSSDFSIRTRQNSNIVYDDDSFIFEKDETKKMQTYERMSANGSFTFDKNLKLYSPKFYEILKNLSKLSNESGEPTGKALYYSDFRHESGSEAFEKILIANGYEKYDHTVSDIDELIRTNSKKKRFTFITGKELQEVKKINKDDFNRKENLRGEYIQLILISSAGAEGISLKCVRQVHIMEPFWNYIRIDQVFGRAIRISSHEDLPPQERNVDEFIYISAIPNGDNVDDLFKTLKESKWPELEEIEYEENIKRKLLEKHKPLYKTITKILSMKKESQNRSVDQILFDIMEKKQNVSSKISDIIKEASIDCIQNTKDDIQLNEKCLRFSSKVKEESSHFPGITSYELNELDKKHFRSTYQYFIKPDIYVILAKKENGNLIYIYYKLNKSEINADVRYIRENGLRICDYDPSNKIFINYEPSSHPLNDLIGREFSIFQGLYNIPEFIYDNQISQLKFPKLNEIINDDNLFGYIVKYNITRKLFYAPAPHPKKNLMKLYDLYEEDNFTIEKSRPLLIIKNGKVFKTV